ILQLIAEIINRNSETIGNRGEMLFDQFEIIAEKQDGKGRAIVDKDAAVAIEHAATWSDDGNGPDAVLFGHLAISVAVNDLEFPETEQQNADHAYDDVGDDSQPRLRQPIVIAKPVRHESLNFARS